MGPGRRCSETLRLAEHDAEWLARTDRDPATLQENQAARLAEAEQALRSAEQGVLPHQADEAGRAVLSSEKALLSNAVGRVRRALQYAEYAEQRRMGHEVSHSGAQPGG